MGGKTAPKGEVVGFSALFGDEKAGLVYRNCTDRMPPLLLYRI